MSRIGYALQNRGNSVVRVYCEFEGSLSDMALL